MRVDLKSLYVPIGICLVLLVALSSLLDLGPYEVPLLAIPLVALLLLYSEFAVPLRLARVDVAIASLPAILLALSLLLPLPYSSLAFMTFLVTMFIPLAPFVTKDPWETLGFSCSLGGLVSVLLMLLNRAVRIPVPELILCISLAIYLASIYLFLKGKSLWKGLKFKFDSYAASVLLLASFFALELILAYPNIFRFTTNDILYHQDRAWELAKNPVGYGSWSYLGFHSLLGSVYLFTRADPFSVILTAVPANLLTFLLIASSFSKLKWGREALLTWSLFTSLSLLAALRYGTDYNGLDKANEASYRSLIWSQPIFFWGLPLTLAIGLLAFLLYSDLYVEGRRKVLYVFSSTSLAFLLHVAEALVFSAYLTLASLLLGGRRYSASGVTLAGVTLYSLYLISGVYRAVPVSASLYLLASGLLSMLFSEARERYLGSPMVELTGLLSRKRNVVISILLAFYTSGLIVWQLHLGEVKVSDIFYLGQVPWFFYPNLVGVTGLLAIVSLKSELGEPLRSYALFSLTSLLLGRTVTYLKLSGFDLPYWEYRFPLYAAVGLAVLSSPILRRLVKLSKSSKFQALLLACLMVFGFSSTALSVERWNQLNRSAASSILASDFRFAIERSSEEFREPLIVFDQYSSVVSSLMHASVVMQPSVWLSEGPEVPLLVLNSVAESDEVAVLTTLGDLAILNGENATYNYLFMFLGPIMSVPSVSTVELSEPPVPNANVTVILPSDVYFMRRSLIAYELVRKELPVHSIYLSDDPRAPPGVCIGPSSANNTIYEEIPVEKWDLRWLYLKGDFSEAEGGLRVRGERNLAITTYELDRGEFELRACGDLTGYIGIIYDFRSFKDYKIFQVYLDRGIALNRIVEGGNVSSGIPSSVPLGWECNEIRLRLSDRLEASVNGRAIELPKVEKLGVLGFETGNFTGVVDGRISGSHSLTWRDGLCSLRLDVAEGGLSDWVDRGLRNLTEAKRAFPGLKINLSGARSEVPSIKAVITGLKASGSVKVEGRPIWVMIEGMKTYLNSTELELRAERLEYLRGDGFYAELSLRGMSGANASEVTVRFRTPVRIEAKGQVRLEGYHAFGRSAAGARDVSEANLTVIAADRTLLLSELEAPGEDLSGRKPLFRTFDETKYLPEAIASFIPLALAFYYAMARIDRAKAEGEARLRRKK